MSELVALGGGRDDYAGLETFPRPEHVSEVTMTSDEVTGVCPITGQPDFYTVTITYRPKDLCLESKSLKLYLGAFRNEGMFGEAMADRIWADVTDALQMRDVSVRVLQKSRGGITIGTLAAGS